MKVRFTPAAQADLQRIHAYISKDDPIAASRVVTRLIEHAGAIGETPYEGPETDEPNARVVVVPRLRYFIFYMITAGDVHITHIRHTSRQRTTSWTR